MFGGADTVYRDFEVTCSHPARETKIAGSWPADIRRGGVDIRGTRIAALQLVVHDLANGFGFWHEGEGGEITGCLIYYNGWQGPDRAHGHGIYAQNKRGTKRIADNILFHQFAYGIHAYGSEKASLDGFDIEGNIAFDNGCLTRGGERSPGIMVGGGCPARRIAIRDNVVVGGSVRLGYPWGTTSDDAVVTGNYIDQGLVLRDFRQATIERNTIVAASHVVQLEGAGKLLLGGLAWDRNEYFLTDGRWGQCTIVEEGKSRGLSFAEWQQTTGLDAASTFTKGAPDKLRIVVRPSAHEPGRAHVAVLNPQSLPEVEVDLAAVLKAGQPFRIVSAKDYYGPPVVSGTYSGQPVPRADETRGRPQARGNARCGTARDRAAFCGVRCAEWRLSGHAGVDAGLNPGAGVDAGVNRRFHAAWPVPHRAASHSGNRRQSGGPTTRHS